MTRRFSDVIRPIERCRVCQKYVGHCRCPMGLDRRRQLLWERDPHCHWCGVLTRLLPGLRGAKLGQPNDMATVDHLDSRLSGRRGKMTKGGVERTVLSCKKCNNERAAAEEAALAREELHRRSGRAPRSVYGNNLPAEAPAGLRVNTNLEPISPATEFSSSANKVVSGPTEMVDGVLRLVKAAEANGRTVVSERVDGSA